MISPERILGAVPNQHIPHWKNKGFFEAAGFIEQAKEADVSIGFMCQRACKLAGFQACKMAVVICLFSLICFALLLF